MNLSVLKKKIAPIYLPRHVTRRLLLVFVSLNLIPSLALTQNLKPTETTTKETGAAKTKSFTNSILNAHLFYNILSADIHASQGNFKSAYIHALKAAQDAANTPDSDALFMKAYLFAMRNDEHERNNLLTKTTQIWLKQSPHSVPAHIAQLELQLKTTEYPNIKNTLQSLINVTPINQREKVLRSIASLFDNIKNYEPIAQLFENALQPWIQDNQNPQSASLSSGIVGLLYYSSQNFEKALSYAEQAQKLNPTSIEAGRLAATILSKINLQLIEATASESAQGKETHNQEPSAPKPPISPEKKVQIDKAQTILDHWFTAQRAVAVLPMLHSQVPSSNTPPKTQPKSKITDTANTEENQKNTQNKLEQQIAQQHAFNLMLDYSRYLLTRSLLGLEDSAQAIPKAQIWAKQALILDETSMVATELLASTYKTQNDWKNIQLLYEKYLGILEKNNKENPTVANEQARYSLLEKIAFTYEKQNNFAEVQRYLRQAIQLLPNEANAYNSLGYLFLERNIHLDEADSLIRKAIALSPNEPAIMDSMGWLLFQQGKVREALPWLEKSYEKTPLEEIAAHLGEAFWKLGDYDKAKQIWRSALKKNQPEQKNLLPQFLTNNQENEIHKTLKRLNISLDN